MLPGLAVRMPRRGDAGGRATCLNMAAIARTTEYQPRRGTSGGVRNGRGGWRRVSAASAPPASGGRDLRTKACQWCGMARQRSQLAKVDVGRGLMRLLCVACRQLKLRWGQAERGLSPQHVVVQGAEDHPQQGENVETCSPPKVSTFA